MTEGATKFPMDIAHLLNLAHEKHEPAIRHFRDLIEAHYSNALSGGMESPVVLLLEARNDPVGHPLVGRLFRGHPEVDRLVANASQPEDGVYLCTAVSAHDAQRILQPVDRLAALGISRQQVGHFPLFVAASGVHLLYGIPVPPADLERPRLIAERIQWLYDSRSAQCEVLDGFMGDLAGSSHLMASVLAPLVQRSFSHIDGFVEMVKRRNYFCAVALLRLQIDNMLRLSAFDLVDDPMSVKEALLEDKPLSKVLSRDRKPLSDSYLCSNLSGRYPWIEEAYKGACGIVHFSGSHIFCAVRGRTVVPLDGVLTTTSLTFEICDPGPVWGDRGVLQTLDAFKAATEGFIELCYVWNRRIEHNE